MKINLLFLCSGRQKLLIILPAFQFFLSRRPIGMLKIRISLQTSADVCRLFVFLPFDVSEVLQRAEDHGLTWPLSANVTNTYAEALLDEKQAAWNTAHVHMFQFFGGVPKILVPDNTKGSEHP